MIQFLKEETFAVNEVILKSWKVFKSRYFSFMGLFVISVLISSVSAIASTFLADINLYLSLFLLVFFLLFYGTIQLTLNKFILNVIDNEEEAKITQSLPTKTQLFRALLAGALVIALAGLVFGVLSVLAWPLIYVVGVESIIKNVVLGIFPTLIFLFLIRLVFCPHFILDKNSTIIESLKYSIALTKKNVVKLLLIFGIFIISNILVVAANYLDYFYLTIFIFLVNLLVLIPLYIIIVTVAYRKMVDNQQDFKF